MAGDSRRTFGTSRQRPGVSIAPGARWFPKLYNTFDDHRLAQALNPNTHSIPQSYVYSVYNRLVE